MGKYTAAEQGGQRHLGCSRGRWRQENSPLGWGGCTRRGACSQGGMHEPCKERLRRGLGSQTPASPLGTVWLRGVWHSWGVKAAMLPQNPSLPWLHTGRGKLGQGESLLSHAASPAAEGPWVCGVEGTRHPTRDRGEVVLDPPSPRGHRGSPATCGHVWGLQPGPACVHSGAGRRVTRLIPPGWH